HGTHRTCRLAPGHVRASVAAIASRPRLRLLGRRRILLGVGLVVSGRLGRGPLLLAAGLLAALTVGLRGRVADVAVLALSGLDVLGLAWLGPRLVLRLLVRRRFGRSLVGQRFRVGFGRRVLTAATVVIG